MKRDHNTIKELINILEGQYLVGDCAIDDTEQRRISRARLEGYNDAITNILNILNSDV